MAALVAPSAAWVALDRAVWPWDQAWYGEVSLSLFFTLVHEPARWPSAMASAFGIKAPAISWIGQLLVPLGQAWGSVERALLVEILLAACLSIVLFHRVVLDLFPAKPAIAWFGAVALASSPLFVGMSHQYFVEMLQLLAVTAFLALAVCTQRWGAPWVAVATAAAGAFAMLVKVSSPLYLLVPAVSIAIRLARDLRRESLSAAIATGRFRWALLGTTLLSIAAGAWYGRNWQTVLGFLSTASAGEASLLYGHRSPFLPKLVFWLEELRKGIAPTEVALLAAGLAAAALLVRAPGRGTLASSVRASLGGLVAVAIPLAVLSLQVNEETRYLLPLVPYALLAVCAALAAAGRSGPATAGLVLVILQFGWVHGVALGLWKSGDARVSPWLLPVHRGTGERALVEEVVRKTCSPQSARRTSIVAVEYPAFNAVTLEFFAEQRREGTGCVCWYTSLGHGETDAQQALRRMMTEIDPPFFITWDRPTLERRVDPFNAVSLAVTSAVEDDPRFREVPGAGPVRLFRREPDSRLDAAAGPVPKKACGTGGSVRKGSVELHGDCRERLHTLLKSRGYAVKG